MNLQEKKNNMNPQIEEDKKLLSPKDGLRPTHQPLHPNADPNGKILNVLWELKKTGKAPEALSMIGYNITRITNILFDKKSQKQVYPQ